MLPVEINGIRGQQPMHETAKISSRCLQYKMDMGFHKAKQIESYVEPLHTFCQLLNEALTIRIVPEDNTSVVPPQGDVVNRTFIFYT